MASVETYLKYAEAIGLTASAAARRKRYAANPSFGGEFVLLAPPGGPNAAETREMARVAEGMARWRVKSLRAVSHVACWQRKSKSPRRVVGAMSNRF